MQNQNSQNNLKRTKVRGLTFPNFKIYSKATMANQDCDTNIKMDMQVNGTGVEG